MIDIQTLTRDERLELIGQLCDSLEDALPPTPAQCAELDRRLAAIDPAQNRPWHELEAELAARGR